MRCSVISSGLIRTSAITESSLDQGPF